MLNQSLDKNAKSFFNWKPPTWSGHNYLKKKIILTSNVLQYHLQLNNFPTDPEMSAQQPQCPEHSFQQISG